MRRIIAFALAGTTVLLVTFTAYVWVGNWFTTRAASGASPFTGGSCLTNGESFNHVVHVAIGAVKNSANPNERVEMTADRLEIRESPPWSETMSSAVSHRCVIRKSDWPDPTTLWIDSPVEGTALTPRGQALLIRDYDLNHWQISSSRGHFPIDVSWK